MCPERKKADEVVSPAFLLVVYGLRVELGFLRAA